MTCRQPCATPVETAEVVSLAHDGRGVAKIDGKAIFVAGALPGEQITLQRLRKQRSADEARLVEVLRAAPERVEPPCQHYGLCGGCALQHMDSGAQVAAKQQQLQEQNAIVQSEETEARILERARADYAARLAKYEQAPPEERTKIMKEMRERGFGARILEHHSLADALADRRKLKPGV